MIYELIKILQFQLILSLRNTRLTIYFELRSLKFARIIGYKDVEEESNKVKMQL